MQEIVDWCKKTLKKDDFFIDLGANVGDIAIPILNEVSFKEALFIEANHRTVEVLKKNIAENTTSTKFQIKHALVLGRTGRCVFHYVTDSPSQSSYYGDRFKEGETERIVTHCTTLDNILDELNVKGDIVMKMDVELSEPLVWKGMVNHMKQFRAIVMEFMPRAMTADTDNDAEDFLNTIRKDGFSIKKLDGSEPTEQDLKDPDKSKIDLALVR